MNSDKHWNMTGSYCLSKKVTRVTSHHLYYSVWLKCPPPAPMQAHRRWRHSPTAHSITVWLRPSHSLLVGHFSSSTSEVLVRSVDSLLINVKQITDFQSFLWSHNDFFNRHALPSIWIIHTTKRRLLHFTTQCAKKTKVIYVKFEISSRCSVPKIIKVGQYIFNIKSYKKYR